MKRVLAILLCLLLALGTLVLIACDEKDNGTNGSGNNNQNNAHVHTYKTDAEWTKDASGHWYAVTCGCVDATVRKLQHVDDNKDAICDVCKFEYDHEHTYSEDWTADCTNHWNTADCGCIIAPANLEAHADANGDGECDTCKYVIEDLHTHYYDTAWTTDGEYHWHAALCEHGAEVADKAAHEINDAGYCTVCGNKIREIDKTDLGAILAAAVANNYKVISGTVVANEHFYEGSAISSGKTDEVFFILGNGDSFVKWTSNDKAGNFIGVDEYWFETISNDEIFGVQIPYYHPNEGTRNEQLEMFPVSGDSEKLNGYTYIPGAILAAGYDDNTTLAQTLANLYDIMSIGANVSNAQSNYDAETGKYTFSYTYFFVTEVTGNTSQDGSGDDITSYTVEQFEVAVEFKVDENFVISLADFTVKSYRNLTGVDEDLTYDPETNTVTMLASADPTIYNYVVSQTSGERTYTSIYPKASLMPADFDLYLVTEYENLGILEILAEEKIEGAIRVEPGKRIYLHVGSVIPASAVASFMDTNDFELTYVTKDGSEAQLWNPNGFYTSPTYSSFSNTIGFSSYDKGEYEVTIRFGSIVKVINLVVGEDEVVVPPSTSTTIYIETTDTYNFENDFFTYTAGEAGKYTFSLPAGLGLAKENLDVIVDFYDNVNGAKAVVELAEGESIDLYVASTEKKLWTIPVGFEAGEVGGGDNNDDIDYTTTIVIGGNTLYISPDEISAGTASRALTITEEGVYQFNGDLFVSGIVDANNTSIEKVDNKFTLVPGSYTVTFTMFSNFGITADTAYALTVINTTAGGGEGGDEPTTETLDATYYAYQEGNQILSVEFNEDGTVVFTFLNPMRPSSLTANYTIANGVVTLTDPETGDAVQEMAASVTLENGVPTSAVYNGWDYDLYAEGDAPSVAEDVELTTGDNTVPVTGTDVMTNVTITTAGAGVYYITLGENAVLVQDGWNTYAAGSVVEIFAEGAGETYTFEVNSEDYTEGTVNLNVSFTAKAEDEPDKDAVAGTHKVGDYTVELFRQSGTGIYLVTISTADYSVCLQFTYTLTDNGDNSYTLDNLVNVPNEYNDMGSDQIDTLVALDWTFSVDPMKEALIGTYATIEGYDVSIIKENGEYFITIASGWDTTFYFTYTVTDNGNGTITLDQTYVENINECGDKETHLSAMEALDITLVYDAEKEALAGTHTDLIDGYKVMFYKSEGVYYANVYTDDYSVDLYFTYTITAGANGSKVITLTYFARPDFETGTEEQANEIAATPIVIGGLEGEGTYESPFVIEEAGDYEAPYAGGYEYPYFQFTAPVDGYATITSTYANLNVQYGSNADVPNNNQNQDGTYANTVTVYLKAGQTVYFTIADNTFPVECDAIPFTASFAPFTSEDPSFLKGEWSGAQTNVGGATPYTFNFNADGTGTGSYVQWGSSTAFTINYTVVDGNTVLVNFTTSGWWAEEKTMTFTYDEEAETLTGDANLIKAKALGLESYQINATNGKYVYVAAEAITLKLEVGASVMAGNVTVTYYVNGVEVKALTFNESAEVSLVTGDQLLVVITADTYSSLTVSKVYPAGSEQNPIVIGSLPYEMTHTGDNGEVYFTYTATEDIILTITCPTGCLVSGTGVSKDASGNYVVTLSAGASLTLNPWANTADTSADSTYTYTITGEAPVVEEPGEGGEGESTGADGTYIAAHASGRKYKVIIDSAAGKITIIRSDLTGNFPEGGTTSVTANYSFDGTTVTYDGTYAMEFDANGAPSKLTWGTQTVTEFVKQ